jgi:hypothetical protein
MNRPPHTITLSIQCNFQKTLQRDIPAYDKVHNTLGGISYIIYAAGYKNTQSVSNKFVNREGKCSNLNVPQ